MDRHQEVSIVSCGRVSPGNVARKCHPETPPRNATQKRHPEMAPGNGTRKWGFLGMLICYTHFSQNSDEAIIKDGYPFKKERITLAIV